MGCFSWRDCVDEEQIVNCKQRDVYVLVPKPFRTDDMDDKHRIKETYYDGYGNFGGHDIFDLVADWNREILSQKPNYIFPHAVGRLQMLIDNYDYNSDYSERVIAQIRDEDWYEFYADLSLTKEEITARVREKTGMDYWEYRFIGIALACYDEDNEALPYPIKITYNPCLSYEQCGISLSDPNQGFAEWEDDDLYDDDEDEYDDGWC